MFLSINVHYIEIIFYRCNSCKKIVFELKDANTLLTCTQEILYSIKQVSLPKISGKFGSSISLPKPGLAYTIGLCFGSLFYEAFSVSILYCVDDRVTTE
jgi:hypothetical protein